MHVIDDIPVRNRMQPSWLNDYVVNSCEHDGKRIVYSTEHEALFTNIYQEQEPHTYRYAKDKIQWIQAMEVETQTLEINETWDIVDLPIGHRPIGCKWMYKIKRKPDGSVDKYKARLVANGFNQVEGINYFDSFSPVAKTVTMRVVLALAAAKC
ncbi:transmembrane signal receptor [Lithospermum erythrorhizon]|uniref:Transmembrane signal receptor n=1 Tax=Lithospermum erythrorhizon TaxID=34254 RepID=A0AAV3PB42_LITER